MRWFGWVGFFACSHRRSGSKWLKHALFHKQHRLLIVRATSTRVIYCQRKSTTILRLLFEVVPIGIDVLPRPGRVYTRPSGEGGTIGIEGQTPNLFGIDFEPAEPDPEGEALDTADTSKPDDSLRAGIDGEAEAGSPAAMEDQVGFSVQ